MMYTCTSSTAQGGGGRFNLGNLWERLVSVMHGWQSEATDGRKGGWRVIAVVACVVTSSTTAGCSAV